MKIEDTLLVVSNHNADISWILEYTNNYLIYDRSDGDEWVALFDRSKVKKVKNIGWDIYDKLTFIIDNYENLPDTMLLTKGNIFKYISKDEFDQICNNKTFTPIFTRNHKTYMPACFYDEKGMFNEINNSWYLNEVKAKYFRSYNDFAKYFGLPTPKYLKFAPGSNYIIPKENILWYSKKFYSRLRDCVSYSMLPGEAQIIERSLYTIWSSPIIKTNHISKPLKKLFIPRPKFSKKTKENIKIILKKIKSIKNIPKKIFSKEKNYFENKSLNELSAYRKKIKIYDIFTYNGEEDILEIRLSILYDHVDKFIIVEAPTTFSGLKKPLYFEKQKERFAKFSDKIRYFVIDDYPNDKEICALADRSPNVPKKGPEHWRREFYQKESIKKALVGLNNNDICFIGDLDEIWNPDVLIDYSRDDIFKLRQEVYTYYLNNRSNERWAGTVVLKYKNIKNNCLNHLRTKALTEYLYIKNGGWHFTNMGGLNEVARKLNDSYTRESYKTEQVEKNLEVRFGKKDYLGRNFKFIIDESSLPEYVVKNKEKYKKLFK